MDHKEMNYLKSIFAGYPKYQKDWGEEVWLANIPNYCAKLLFLNKGMQCSFHMHPEKIETFFILSGDALITLGNNKIKTYKSPGDSVHLPAQTLHRFAAPFTDVVILEVSTTHSDDDVVRLEPSGNYKP
jgi:mannose-6-phosphate isomerase-like protein (cupin superfamily)